jgi:hypothetical protein
MFVACVLRLIVLFSVHFVEIGSFFKAIIVTLVKCVVHCPVSYKMLISYGIGFETILSHTSEYIPGASSKWPS